MCKFTNRLFVFIVLFHVAVSKPMRPARLAGEISPRRSDLLEFLYDDYNDYGFQEEQIHYDQRQKGEENLRVRLDGFFIEFPTLDDPYSLDVLAEQYINNALLMEKSKQQGTTDGTHVYQTESSNLAAPVINIPAPKKDVESRQGQGGNEYLTNSTRTKSRILQLLQILRRV